MMVLGVTFGLFQFPGPCILTFFQILQMTSFYSKGNINLTSNFNIRFIGVNFSVCVLRNPKGFWCCLLQQQVLVYVHTSFYRIGLCNVGRFSIGCIDRLCHSCCCCYYYYYYYCCCCCCCYYCCY